jgi:hypothetical protein
VPALGDSEDDGGEADGMYIGRGNRSARRKPAPAPLLSITKFHTYDFVVLTSLAHPRKILLAVLQIGKAKDLSAPLRVVTY